MATFEIGLVAPIFQYGPERTTPRWPDIRAIVQRAEDIGFDTIWTPDELVWFSKTLPPQGAWEGVAMAGAVAAVTSKVTVGTWVLSALHRNPGITAKAVETLDEISGGRFLFGLGAGHAYPGQAHAFGLPEEGFFARFEEALEIIVPLLRRGEANFEGRFHVARELPQRPQGPRPGAIPLMIGSNGPRGQRLAVRHAEIWSCYIEERAEVSEVAPRIASLRAICEDEGRAFDSISRSVGLYCWPLEAAGVKANVLSGSTDEIADGILSFRDAGFTRLELMFGPGTMEALEALAPVLERVRAA